MIYTFTLNVAIDRIIELEKELQRRMNNVTKKLTIDVGGKATHVSIILSQLGIDNIATGIIGSKNKDILLELLNNKYGVKTEFVEQDEQSRESIILVDPTGKGSFMITQKGFVVNEETYQCLLSYIENKLRPGDLAVFAGSPPQGITAEKYGYILEMVLSKDVKVIVDAARDYLKEAVQRKVFLIKPNEDEFVEFCGIPIKSDKKEYLPYLDDIRKHGVENIVLSLGKDGSILSTEDGRIYRYYPPEIVQKNDTGTGDSFVGGIVAEVSRGALLKDALVFGTAVSASKASRLESSGFDMQDAERFVHLVKEEQWR